MRTLSISTVLLGAVSLSACVSASSPPSFENEYQDYTPLAAEVYDISCLEEDTSGCTVSNNTYYEDLPTSGIGHYRGLLLSTEHFCAGVGTACSTKEGYSGPKVEYIARLFLEVDFLAQTASGSLSDFVTKLPGFKNPVGVIKLEGRVCDTRECLEGAGDGMAYLSFNSDVGNENVLRENGNVAVYWFNSESPNGWDLGADGAFGGNSGTKGTDGQVLAGTFGSDFEWIGGIYLDSTSGSDGDWAAIVQ